LHPNIQEIIAWKNGEFWFNNTSIQSIMRQIARWYNVDIAYKGNLSDVKLSGVLSKKQNVEALFNILEATKQVRFKEDQNIITVTPYSGS
jgi:ferric-dicitrate binding protein FerR (iron transport regulator)